VNENSEIEEVPISRRTFLDKLFIGSIIATVLAILGPMVRYLFPGRESPGMGNGVRVEVAKLEDLPEGRAARRIFKGRGVLIVRTAAGIAALGLKCTHLSCNVEWNPSKKVVECPCHLGVFDLEGNVLAGPPPRPLPKYEVEVVDDRVYVLGEA